jgi:hypothetical protein
MEESIIEKHNSLKRASTISVRPFVDPNPNMGLENYRMVLFEGIVHEEPLMCKESNGIKRYITGLNEFAPEIKSISDPDEREAAINEIRQTVAQLEKELKSNVIDPKDEMFWTKVQLLRPDNDDFWEKIIIRCGNDPVFLEPTKDPMDLIKQKAIEAGGFSMIARSYEDARGRSGNNRVKFYLDKFEETVATRTEVKKLRNKALGKLQNLYDQNTNKLFLICKLLDPNSTQYKKNTPNDIMYENMDKYINGEGVETDKKKTAQHFMNAADMDMETLKLKVLVKDGFFYKVFTTKPDGHIYHIKTNTFVGKNQAEIVEYLKNPINEDIFKDVIKTIEKYWVNG